MLIRDGAASCKQIVGVIRHLTVFKSSDAKEKPAAVVCNMSINQLLSSWFNDEKMKPVVSLMLVIPKAKTHIIYAQYLITDWDY